MAKQVFQTLPDELLPLARIAVAHFEATGYKVKVEPGDVSHPSAATMVAIRHQTTLVALVDKSIPKAKIEAWVAYCASSGRDTRLVLVTPENAVDDEGRDFLRGKRVGHCCSKNSQLVEELPTADLALNVVLPSLQNECLKVRRLLGSTYDHFERSQWREGFDEACSTLEQESRRYFAKWQKTKRIVPLKKGKPYLVASRALNKMPIGPLIELFGSIQSKNATDSIVEKALREIKKDRNDSIHRKNQPKTENTLRKNVGRHMYTIIAALRAIHK
jgi:hypothetical protein